MRTWTLIAVLLALLALVVAGLEHGSCTRLLERQARSLEMLAVASEETTRARLYLEESLTGDRSLNPERDVLQLLEEARDLLQAGAHGGTTRLGEFESAPELAPQLDKLADQLRQLQELARARLEQRAGPAAFVEVYATFLKQAQQLSAEIKERTRAQLRLAQTLTGLGGLVALLGLVAVFWLGHRTGHQLAHQLTVMRDILRQIRKVTIQLTGVTNSIGASARQQQASVAEQASTVTEIMATSREISATSRELANTVHSLASSADETARVAGEGESLLRSMQVNMGQIVEASNVIVSRLATLSEKASSISTVLTTISRVAGQTNLLSVNAAIEAEKAGEFGRGFAVVATEIRRLADQTDASSGDIVREVQSAVSAGVMGMDKFREEIRRSEEGVQQVVGQLRHIIGRVQTMVTVFDNVNDGMRSQAQGAEQIADSITQLSEAAQETAAGLKELGVVVSQLQDSTQLLQEAAKA